MLFVQGTRDTLADMDLLRPVLATLGERASLVELETADHSFHVRASSGRRDPEVPADLLDAAAAWMIRHAE